MTSDEKSQALLKRVASDQSGPMSGPPAIARDDEDAADPVVIWGKRVGRVIGYGLLIVLVINLATGWFF